MSHHSAQSRWNGRNRPVMREAQARYQQSAKGRAAQARYEKTLKGFLRGIRGNARRRKGGDNETQE